MRFRDVFKLSYFIAVSLLFIVWAAVLVYMGLSLFGVAANFSILFILILFMLPMLFMKKNKLIENYTIQKRSNWIETIRFKDVFKMTYFVAVSMPLIAILASWVYAPIHSVAGTSNATIITSIAFLLPMLFFVFVKKTKPAENNITQEQNN